MSAVIPVVVTIEWAHRLLAIYGWLGHSLDVRVQHDESALLLEPTPYAWVKGDAERIWLGTSEQHPNATIMSAPGCMTVNRFESEADLRWWMMKAEKELAA